MISKKKKSSWPSCGTWFGLSGEGRSNPRQWRNQKVTSSFCVNQLFDSQYEFGDPKWRHEDLSQQMGSVTRFMNGASQEIKVKNKRKSTTEILPWKFNWKKIQPRILWKRTFKEDSKFNELWNFSIKQKKKNTQIQRTLFSGNSLW